MQFVKKLTDKRSSPADIQKNVITLTLDELSKVLTNDTRVVSKSPPTLSERLTGDKPNVTAYLDSDTYYDLAPPEEEYTRVFEKFKDNIIKLMEDQQGFDINKVAFAQRHGHDPKHPNKAIKISYRAFLIGWMIFYTAMPAFINSKRLAGDRDGLFDINPYKAKEQLLSCIWCCKGRLPGGGNDRRVLKPITNHSFEHFLAKNFDANSRDIWFEPEETKRPAHNVRDITPRNPDCTEVKTLVSYLNLLSKDRWDDRTTWIRLGYALYNYSVQYQTDLLWCWLKFSGFSAKYDEANARATWESFGSADGGSKVTIGTIKMYAKIDSPEEYIQLAIKDIPPLVLENWNKGDKGLALISEFLLKDVIKLSSGRGKRDFYYFDHRDNLWTLAADSKIKMVFSKALEDILREVQTKFTHDARLATEDNVREALDRNVTSILKVIAYVQSNKGLNNVIGLGSDLFLQKGFEQSLDSTKHLLGVRNGVIDLRTGDLRQRRPEDMIFKIVDVDYDPQANDNWVKEMVLSAMADDQEMAEYLQKVLGYSMTGETREECFIIFTGSGRNCKGSLMQTLASILGDFYVEMNPAVICDRQTCNIDAERAKLLGARVAVFNELEPGEKLKSAEVQLLSGGDLIPAKPLFKDPISIVPQHQCFLTTNHMPQLAEVIIAIVERIICVNFQVTFCDLEPGEEPSKFRRQRDNNIKDRLSNDRPAFLKWLVNGASRWYDTQDIKRNAPQSVKAFTREYLHEQDSLQAFISQKCEVRGNYRVGSAALLEKYNEFCDGALSAKAFVSKMKNKGFVKKLLHFSNGPMQGFEGLRLKPAQD